MRDPCHQKIGSSTSLGELLPHVAEAARLFIARLRALGITVTVTSTYRSRRAQQLLYENYLNGCSLYPAARPGESHHELRVAFDLHLDPPLYGLAGALWERAGGTWGGRFADEIHFEV